METKELTCYSCGYCGKLYRNKQQADECHGDRVCCDCGKVIGKQSYNLRCKSCDAKFDFNKVRNLYNKAEKLTYEEYVEKYKNNPIVIGDEYYFGIDDYLYDIESYDGNDDVAKWAWGTKSSVATINCGDILDRFIEEVNLEDYDVVQEGVVEIENFCKDWNEKYAETVYYEDNSVVVLLYDIIN